MTRSCVRRKYPPSGGVKFVDGKVPRSRGVSNRSYTPLPDTWTDSVYCYVIGEVSVYEFPFHFLEYSRLYFSNPSPDPFRRYSDVVSVFVGFLRRPSFPLIDEERLCGYLSPWTHLLVGTERGRVSRSIPKEVRTSLPTSFGYDNNFRREWKRKEVQSNGRTRLLNITFFFIFPTLLCFINFIPFTLTSK